MIPYIGSKSKISNFIIPNIPTDIKTYVEPFGGAFSIFFCLDIDKFENTSFVYNDVNYFNYNLFKYLKDPNFIFHIINLKATEYLYSLAKQDIFNSSDFDKAIYWLIILTCGHSQVGVLNGKWKNDGAFEVLKMKLINNRNYFQRIKSIYNTDYKEIIKKYDSKDTFFYLDPPYFNKESYYINHDFTNVDNHKELADLLKTIKGKFALSYFDFPMLEEWYGSYNKKTHETFMGRELLIMNY